MAEYSPALFASLVGELLGVGPDEVGPVAALGAVSIALFRPLLLLTWPPISAQRGGSGRGCFSSCSSATSHSPPWRPFPWLARY